MVVGPILKSRAFASSDSAESSELPLKTNGSWRVAQDFCSRTTSATPGHGTAVSDAVLVLVVLVVRRWPGGIKKVHPTFIQQGAFKQ